MNTRTRKITIIAMLSAIAYVVMVVGRIPIVMFLKYDPKDVIITIGGFMFGPLTAFAMSAVVSFVEMLSVSDTGFIGLIMNVISTCAFACTAAVVYKKRRTISGAVIGLVLGCVLMTVLMLLWNYLITPIYLGYPREAVAALLVPVLLPFNLVKAGLNMAFTLLLYKPLQTALKKSNLLVTTNEQPAKTKYIGMILVSLLLLTTCVFFALVLKGVL